jgi:5'-nucleotidase
MSHLLITNDDGIDSPALPPLARTLSTLDRVEVAVPDRERSWISKAITRHDEIRVEQVERDGITMWTTTGYPADCTQLGIHSLFDGPPRLVVSGINLGFNFGAAYMLSSGTVGAAAEAWINGVPAIAISAGTNGDWPTWAKWVLTPDALPMWERVAEVAGEIVAAFLEHGFPEGADVISVNIPEDADLNTPRRIVDVARVGYDRLFGARAEGVYAHEFGGAFVHFAGLEGTDVEAARRGDIAIAPIRLHQPGTISEALRAALEQ